MMTPDEMIAVLQAFKDGKQIQSKGSEQCFLNINNPSWDFSKFVYRVKPPLKTGYIAVYEGNKMISFRIHETASSAEKEAIDGAKYKIIKIQWEE